MNDHIINIDLFEDSFFREAVQHCVLEHHTHYGDRLLAFYVWGSVHRNEAVPAISNLNIAVFTSDGYTEADKEWDRWANPKLKREIPGFFGIPFAHSAEETLFAGLQQTAEKNVQLCTRAWMDRLRYDATLVRGTDLINGIQTPVPDAAWAHQYLQSPRNLVRHTAGLEEKTDNDFKFPEEPPLRLRKLARVAVLAGAYLLMGLGEFRSFKGTEVLPALTQAFPQWRQFLEETSNYYKELHVATDEQVSAYLLQLVLWVDWVEQQVTARL